MEAKPNRKSERAARRAARDAAANNPAADAPAADPIADLAAAPVPATGPSTFTFSPDEIAALIPSAGSAAKRPFPDHPGVRAAVANLVALGVRRVAAGTSFNGYTKNRTRLGADLIRAALVATGRPVDGPVDDETAAANVAAIVGMAFDVTVSGARVTAHIYTLGGDVETGVVPVAPRAAVYFIPKRA